MKERKRLNLEFEPEFIDLLQDTMQRTNAASFTEVLRRAIRAYDFMTERMDRGSEITIRNAKTGKEERFILL